MSSVRNADFAQFAAAIDEYHEGNAPGYLMKDRRRGARRVTKHDPHASENTDVPCYRPRFLRCEAIARAERLDARLARLSCIEDEAYVRPIVERPPIAMDRAIRQPHGSIVGYAGAKRTVYVGQKPARMRPTAPGGPTGYRIHASPFGRAHHYLPHRGIKSIGAEERFAARLRGKHNLLVNH